MKKRRKEEKIKSLVKGPLFKRHKPLHYSSSYRVNKDIKREIEKRYNILTTIIVLAVIILIGSLFVVQVVNNEHYKEEMETLTQKIVDGPSAPRGRIYDRNGKIIVDNKANKVIYYQKPANVTTKDEMEVAY